MRVLFTLTIALSLYSDYAYSNITAFEGSIKIVRQSVYDTSYITINVKANWVRIDEQQNGRFIGNSLLVDIAAGKVYSLSPSRKLYAELKLDQSSPVNRHVEVIKTNNCTEFNGFACCQWRIRDKARNSEVTYWVARKNFEFYDALLKLLGKLDSPIGLLTFLEEANGNFPILTIERTPLRKEKMRYAVVDIKDTRLSDQLFRIPREYRRFEH